ncbi:MAG: hypothetical protein R3F39_09825 [Myxococcota bacterium]
MNAHSSGIRDRMLAGLRTLPLAADDDAEILVSWLEIQPEPESPREADPTTWTVGLSSDGSRLTWYAAGLTEAFVPTIGEFLMEAGASGEELEGMAAAGQHLEPTAAGSWVELSAGGLDGGWFFPSPAPLAKARAYAPQHAVTAQLLDWARRCSAQAAAQFRRSVTPGEEVSELLLPIPGRDRAQDLDLAKHALEMLGAPWFRTDVARALVDADDTSRLLVVGLNGAGLARAGVLLTEPSPRAARALALLAAGTSPSALDRFEAALGVAGPQWVAAIQRPEGFSVELYYSP